MNEIKEVPEYNELRQVLEAAYRQAADGKGKERHAELNEPFEKQKICEITRRLKGSPVAGALFQTVKKIYESSRLPLPRAKAELLGAINYLAAAIILIDEMIADEEYRRAYISRVNASGGHPSFDEAMAEEPTPGHRLLVTDSSMRAGQILKKTKELLRDGTPQKVVLELIDEMESEKGVMLDIKP